MTRREALLDAIRAQPEISVLIVGGGINGAGLFRELALQGVDTLLVDKADFCAGASAASSRLIHGGLRYLENGEFRLVREALGERNLLLRNAPHYVKPLPTTIPIFSWTAGTRAALGKFFGRGAKPGNRGALLVKAGLTLYDLFTYRRRALPTHRFAARAAALARRPRLNPKIVCTATYYDAWVTHPERLCLELVQDAETLSPRAAALNYLAVQGAAGDTVTLRDELSGATLDVRPRLLVNATGAWIDFTNRALRQPTRFIGGTKGSHLVVRHPELFAATGGQMLYYENADGRICLLFPFHDTVLVGTTDIRVHDPETARCEEDEVDYMLESVRRVFPTIALDRSRIVFRFCGVRPLPRSDASTTGQISRDHHCAVTPPNDAVAFPTYSLIGGKWTTFRAFAEGVADRLLRALGRPRQARTDALPIGGGRGYPGTATERRRWLAALGARTGLAPDRLATLLERYGTRAAAVAAFLVADSDAPLRHHPGYSRREIAFLVARERVVHLDDLVLRRTSLAPLGQLSRDLLTELAAIVAATLGWSEETLRGEIERTTLLLERDHGWQAGRPGLAADERPREAAASAPTAAG